MFNSSRVLTYYTKLTETYWRQYLGDTDLVLKGYRVQRTPGVASGSRDPSSYIAVSDVTTLVPFPGRQAEDDADVNSFLKNSLAILNLPQAFYSAAAAGFIRIATDVGPNLAGFSGMIKLFTSSTAKVLSKLPATVTGTTCPASLGEFDPKGIVNTTFTSCVSALTTVNEACIWVEEGSSIVVVGADNNQYLVALNRFKKRCQNQQALSLLGSSMAFADHRDYLCNNLTGVTCGTAFPTTTTSTATTTPNTTTTQQPTTKTTSVLSTTVSSNNATTISTTSQAKTTSRAGNDPVPHGDDPPANASKFRSIFQFLTALLAGGK
ncbi:unnamed protein product [Notodromas monacha]|uniref:Uncharacterized protein n=1 Tax=Notodromas monacha TaxID=399045 RepID=A0A7R9BZV1_9CRUS|nr:unnamed protein product [Notodromas monacha]CAG0923735.1 unnamed protein product [Notodromas monacha]